MTTKYYYDTDQHQQGGVPYGNLTRTEEYDQNGVLYRTDQSFYNALDTISYPSGTGSYIVDRRWDHDVWDGHGYLLSLTHYLYDYNTGVQSLGSKGELTASRTYYDILPNTTASTLANATLHGTDTTYSYDSYGNQTVATTYTSYGATSFNGSVSNASFGTVGVGTPRPTLTYYDPNFHAYEVRVDNPATNGITLTETANYDYRMGVMTSINDYNSNTSFIQIDNFGRMLHLYKPRGGGNYDLVEDYTYYDGSIPYRYLEQKHDDYAFGGDAREISHFYDGVGKEIQTKSESQEAAQNIIEDFVYDGLGQLHQSSQARYVNESAANNGPFWYYTAVGNSTTERWTSSSYDGLGRVVSVQPPDTTISPTITNYFQWSGGIAASVIDANGHANTNLNDVFGRLVQVNELSGGTGSSYPIYATTNYTYDPRDLLITVTNATGNSTSMSYDGQGRKTAMYDPDMGNWTYNYDPNGNLTQQRDAKSQIITFTYDALNRLTTKSYPDGSQSNYNYDQSSASNGLGQLTSISDATGSTAWQYDAQGRKIQATYNLADLSGSRTFKWSYDKPGRIQNITYPAVGGGASEVLTYTYNAAWQPDAVCSNYVTNNNNQGQCYINDDAYSALNQPTYYNLGNLMTNDWVYNNPMARLSTWQVYPSTTPGQNQVLGRNYTYDGVGNITSIYDFLANQTQNFGYDERDRLTNAYTTGSSTNAYSQTYSYDQLGNFTSKAGVGYGYTNGHPHEASSIGGQSYSYDANGNQTAGGGYNLTWNYDNQPITSTVGSTNEYYRYDANNERLERITNGQKTFYLEGGLWEEDATTSRAMIQFGGQVIAQRTRNNSNNTTSSLIYLHNDQVNSVSLATDGNTGSVVSQQQFDPWGALRSGSGSVSQTDINYTGQVKDGSGLLFYQSRYYNPVVGRFISADNIAPNVGNPQSLNRYSYVENNPMSHADPSGHCSKDDEQCIKQLNAVEANKNFLTDSAGIEGWGWDRLTILLWWLNHGIAFEGEGSNEHGSNAWTGANLWDAVQALSRVHNFLGDKIFDGLGTSGGNTLYFTKVHSGREDDGAIGGLSTPWNRNLFMYIPDDHRDKAIETMVHELGHYVDNSIGTFSAQHLWTIASGWYWDKKNDDNGEWMQTKTGMAGAVSRYAWNAPNEDFAETFTWAVENNAGGSQIRADLGHGPSISRLEALNVAIGLIP